MNMPASPVPHKNKSRTNESVKNAFSKNLSAAHNYSKASSSPSTSWDQQIHSFPLKSRGSPQAKIELKPFPQSIPRDKSSQKQPDPYCVTMTGTLRHGHTISLRVRLSTEELDVIENSILTSERKAKECHLDTGQGPHILLLTLLLIPVIFLLAACYSFYLGTMTWYNILVFYSEAKSVKGVLLSPLIVLAYPFLIAPSVLLHGLYVALVQVSWHFTLWRQEVADWEKGFYGWLCCQVLHLEECSPYQVVILSKICWDTHPRYIYSRTTVAPPARDWPKTWMLLVSPGGWIISGKVIFDYAKLITHQIQRKCESITIEKKKEICQLARNNPTMSKNEIGERFSLPRTTVRDILTQAEKVGKFSDLEDALFNWFTQKRANNIIITDDLLREKAKKLGEQLDVPENFTYSSGWLQQFKGRFHISQRWLCGEGAPISPAIIDEHLTNLNSMLANSGYDPANIYNADETGLFFQLIPDRTLAHKDENCRGVRRMKQRITVLLCCNSTGTDKWRLLIIGKSAKPRCFRNFSPHFYCTYTSNSKA
ncbi:hypothetical protein LAZ67_2002000 [Cordylochernes scorpioides]|uniref:HTH CENPB-type domain-containing protein n=1 Tax=Cordylochernes scorpioides TaxID=51811 RepID=A0ABY6K4X3_9ARAC|nr:hypothetical protein LAZ67_2002000 [Cordylochernes scorpioides]